jgi:hypothetical protein
MKLTFARVGALALVATLASLVPLYGRVRRSTPRGLEFFDPSCGEWASYEFLVLADARLAEEVAR